MREDIHVLQRVKLVGNGAAVIEILVQLQRLHAEHGLSVTVVPDSGTGELTGLTGSMKIAIAAGKHADALP